MSIREEGIVVAASSFPGWSNVPLADLVQAKVSRPVRSRQSDVDRERNIAREHNSSQGNGAQIRQ